MAQVTARDQVMPLGQLGSATRLHLNDLAKVIFEATIFIAIIEAIQTLMLLDLLTIHELERSASTYDSSGLKMLRQT